MGLFPQIGEVWFGENRTDLAAAAKVTPSWIRQLINSGELKAHKAGRDWLISDSEARRFLRERGEK